MSRWDLLADMNLDGATTISDVFLWLKWVFFLPGDAVIFAVMDTAVGRFFEVTPSSYYGAASGIISFLLWLGLMQVLGGALSASIRSPDYQPDLIGPARETNRERIARERREDLAKPWWARRYHYDGWIVVGGILAIAVMLLVEAVKTWL